MFFKNGACGVLFVGVPLAMYFTLMLILSFEHEQTPSLRPSPAPSLARVTPSPVVPLVLLYTSKETAAGDFSANADRICAADAELHACRVVSAVPTKERGMLQEAFGGWMVSHQGIVIAEDVSDLWRDAQRPFRERVWTGFWLSGEHPGETTCADWTSAEASRVGICGAEEECACDLQLSLLCICLTQMM
jgi:hypothetical protein